MMAIRPGDDPAVPVEARDALLAAGERLRPGPGTRAGLSRLPRWVTALGLVLVLGELTGAALLAKGPRGLATGPGVLRTVVLRVYAAPVQGITCHHCSPMVSYSTPTVSGTGGAMGDGGRMVPFITTVRVRSGGTVTLDGSYVGAQSITCSVAVDGKVVTKNTDNQATDGPAAHCQSVIP